MKKSHRTGLALVTLVAMASSPGSAVGGYDIAHIVELTCEPGGALIVTDEWKGPQDRGHLVTEPGEVIGCPPAGLQEPFQIGAGPERIGRDGYLCTYLSLRNGDGADTCAPANFADQARSVLTPLVAVRVDRSGQLAVIGIAGDDAAAIAPAPTGAISPEPATVIPIDGERAARLGASGAFSYFSLTLDRRTLCAAEKPPRVLARDGSGAPIAETIVPMSISLLDATDRVLHARPVSALCASPVADEPVPSGWVAVAAAVLRAVVTAVI